MGINQKMLRYTVWVGEGVRKKNSRVTVWVRGGVFPNRLSPASSSLPGYGIAFPIDSPWISSGTSSVQPPRSGAVVQQRGLGADVHVEAALQSTHPLGSPPGVPHGFALALTAELKLGKRICRLRL